MDIFSLLPLFILFYAIATILNPGNKNQRRPRPNHQDQTSTQQHPSSFPAPKTWREKFEEMERELFPREEDPIPRNKPVPVPDRTMGKSPSRSFPKSDRLSMEGLDREGYSGTEGTQGVEGIAGTEGTAGSEGIPTAKKPPRSEGVLTTKPKQLEQLPSFSGSRKASLVQGVIWAEILGKPRSRSGWDYRRRH